MTTVTRYPSVLSIQPDFYSKVDNGFKNIQPILDMFTDIDIQKWIDSNTVPEELKVILEAHKSAMKEASSPYDPMKFTKLREELHIFNDTLSAIRELEHSVLDKTEEQIPGLLNITISQPAGNKENTPAEPTKPTDSIQKDDLAFTFNVNDNKPSSDMYQGIFALLHTLSTKETIGGRIIRFYRDLFNKTIEKMNKLFAYSEFTFPDHFTGLGVENTNDYYQNLKKDSLTNDLKGELEKMIQAPSITKDTEWGTCMRWAIMAMRITVYCKILNGVNQNEFRDSFAGCIISSNNENGCEETTVKIGESNESNQLSSSPKTLVEAVGDWFNPEHKQGTREILRNVKNRLEGIIEIHSAKK